MPLASSQQLCQVRSMAVGVYSSVQQGCLSCASHQQVLKCHTSLFRHGQPQQIVALWVQEEGLSLELSSKDTYEDVSRQLAAALTPPLDDPQKLRFTQQNNYTQQPKPQALRFPTQEQELPEMLQHFGQTSDTLFYEVLDLPLPELERLKTLKASVLVAACKQNRVKWWCMVCKMQAQGVKVICMPAACMQKNKKESPCYMRCFCDEIHSKRAIELTLIAVAA